MYVKKKKNMHLYLRLTSTSDLYIGKFLELRHYTVFTENTTTSKLQCFFVVCSFSIFLKQKKSKINIRSIVTNIVKRHCIIEK